MFRREWRQQLLVLTLLTLAVAAAVAGASTATNAATHGDGSFGNATARVHIEAEDPARAQATIAAVRRRFGEIEVTGHQIESIPGSAEPLDIRAQEPGGRFGGPTLALRHGRYPTAAGEVALTGDAADRLSTSIGDEVRLARQTWKVVGEVENPDDLDDEFALVAPGSGFTPTSFVVLTDLNGRGTDDPDAPGATGPAFGVEGAPSDDTAVAALVLVVVTLTMSLVALIAAAGFVVVAQRRQRQLGLLAALGATERHLRLVMLANGVIVGMVAAVVGGGLGVLGWIAAAPAVEGAAGHRLDRLGLPWGLILESLLIAVLASAAAAWWPARAIARVPVMAALSRRPVRPVAVHRSLIAAIVLLGGGVAAISGSRPTGDVRPLVLMGGVLAVVIGVVLVSPTAIRVLAVPAGRLPFASRLALRDLVRYQARAAAALAAITLGLGVSVGIVVIAKANEPRGDEGNLSSSQILVQVAPLVSSSGPGPGLSPVDLSQFDEAAASVAAAVGEDEPLALDVARNPAPAEAGAPQEGILAAIPIDHGFRGGDHPFVATPEVLASLGVDPSAIDPSTELLTSKDPHLVLLDTSVRPDTEPTASHTQLIDLPTYSSGPRSLITEHAMEAHGWVATRYGWLIESDTPFTSAQIDAARQAAAQSGLTVEARSHEDGLAALRTVSALVGGLLALAIVAMTMGLLRGEAAQDLRTLTATGAGARTRRTITATTAGALALLGVVLSTAGADAAVVAGYHAELDRLVPLPTTHLLLLAVGLPLVASAGGWLLAGREPRTFSRQALD
jgi:putative ABC transport system permease protein